MSVAGARASLRPSSSSGSITFSSAFRLPSSWKLWNTKPTLLCAHMRRARPRPERTGRVPASRTVPLRGRVEPGDDRQQRALARAGGTDDGRRIPARRVRNSMSCRMISVPVESVHRLGDVLDGNDRVPDMSSCLRSVACDAARAARTVACCSLAAVALPPRRHRRSAAGSWCSATACRAEYGLERGSGWVRAAGAAAGRRTHRRDGGQRQHQRRHDLGRAFAVAGAAEAAQARASSSSSSAATTRCAACR